MYKVICAKYVVKQGNSVPYYDKNESKTPENAAIKKQQRKRQHQNALAHPTRKMILLLLEKSMQA